MSNLQCQRDLLDHNHFPIYSAEKAKKASKGYCIRVDTAPVTTRAPRRPVNSETQHKFFISSLPGDSLGLHPIPGVGEAHTLNRTVS